jgi:hypothetical protein
VGVRKKSERERREERVREKRRVGVRKKSEREREKRREG